jgi:hypothetical protein
MIFGIDASVKRRNAPGPEPRLQFDQRLTTRVTDQAALYSRARKIRSMSQQMQADRLQLHSLLDLIPSEDLRAVEKVLRAFAGTEDPVARALLAAPHDPEALSEHESAGVAEYEAARADGKRFKTVVPDDLLKEFGFEDADQ